MSSDDALGLITDCALAIADLGVRCGARNLEIGYARDPGEPGYDERGPGWHASIQLRGARIIMDEQPSVETACDGLAHRILDGGRCTHCGEVTSTKQTDTGVYLHSGRAKKARCIWERVGDRWKRGCEQ